jgi:hypothetical protein
MKTLRFEIDTDASYTADEIEELQNSWVSWMTDVDPDADGDTADVRIVKPSTNRDEEIVKFLDEATITVRLKVDGEGIGFETTLK